MADTLEFTLNNPLTEEQWDMITDVDFDHTERIWFHTKHGKEVEFTKVIRCKDCRHKHIKDNVWTCPFGLPAGCDFYCGYGERETDNG